MIMGKLRRLNKEIVVAAAAELANRRSTADLTLTELAAVLNVRVPSLYNHIAGLDGMRRDLALFGLRDLLARLRQAAFGRVGREALLALAHAYRQFAHEQPGVYPLTLVAPAADDAEWVALSRELVQMMLLLLASYGLQGDTALHAIRGLRALLHGFVSLEAQGGFGLPLDRDESYQWLMTTYLDGLMMCGE